MAKEYNIPQNNPSIEPIDWTSITKDLITSYSTIKKERELEKEKLDSLVDVNSKILQATQLGKSPSVNEFILKGTESGRVKMSEWNKLLKTGQISPSEYKRKINNLMDNWNQFAVTAKTYDERMQEIFKNQQPNEKGEIKGSALELERANELAQYQDLKNKELIIDDQNGKVYLGKLNNGLLDPTSITDIRSLNNFSNIIDNKIQLANLVDEGTKNWKSFKIENGVTTTNDIRQNKDAYAKAKATLINGILSNNNSIASVLTDYTQDEYDYYLNNDDFKSRVEKRIKSENDARQFNNKPPMNKEETEKFIESQKSKFILLEHDDQGVLQPILTEEQSKAAFNAVDNEIEIRMGKEVFKDEPYRGGSGGGGGSDEKEKPISDIAKRVYGATKMSDKNEAAKQMSIASGGKYVFKYDGNALNVYTTDAARKELVKQNETPLNSGSNWANNLWAYFPVTDTEWMNDLSRLRQSGGGATQVTPSKNKVKFN
jgi:hypothetical protein